LARSGGWASTGVDLSNRMAATHVSAAVVELAWFNGKRRGRI
jgi:hypothetical protein